MKSIHEVIAVMKSQSINGKIKVSTGTCKVSTAIELRKKFFIVTTEALLPVVPQSKLQREPP